MTICPKVLTPVLLALICAWASGLPAQDTIDIKVNYEKGIQYRVQSQVQHSGRVIIIDRKNQESNAESLPLQVGARLSFYERFVGTETNPQVVRYYDQSKAEIQVDKETTLSELSENSRLIVTRLSSDEGKIQSASIVDLLEQSELELLETPADPLTFAGLLNRQKIEVGAEWTPEKDALAKFLGVDSIFATDLKLKLQQATAGQAKVYIMGNVKADVNDVSTEMDISGVLTVERNSNHVSSVRLNINEKRDAGQIAPGFDGKTKIDLEIATGQSAEQLTQESLAKVTQSRTVQRLLKWQSDGCHFRLQYDPAWKIITSDSTGAIMRYLDDGKLLCQCTMVELEQRPATNPVKLEEYKQYIAKMIAVEQSQRVLSADQSVTGSGAEILRVKVYGQEQDLPLNWVYFNVTHTDGRQVALVFTLEEELADRIAPIAQKLVNGLVFPPPRARDAKAYSKTSSSATQR